MKFSLRAEKKKKDWISWLRFSSLSFPSKRELLSEEEEKKNDATARKRTPTCLIFFLWQIMIR